MAISLITFLIICLAVAVFGIIIYAFVKIYGSGDDATNRDIIDNYLSDYTDGYGLVMVVSKESMGDYWKIKVSPADIDYQKLKKKELKIEFQDLFVRKDLLIEKGNSQHRNSYYALPENKEDLPDKIKPTILGQLFAQIIDEKNKEKNRIFLQRIKEQENMKLNIMSEKMATEITTLYKDVATDVTKLTKQQLPEKEERKSLG